MKTIVFICGLLAVGFVAEAQDKSAVNSFLNKWHEAAAKADADTFFNSIAEDGIYIGTDSSERWTKSEFEQFAKPYFKRGKAWDFKPFNRDIHFSKKGDYVWFSELLDTWMGVCRGSGILRKQKTGWEIQQYHLAVTVPNEVIKDFITLIDNFHKSNPKK